MLEPSNVGVEPAAQALRWAEAIVTREPWRAALEARALLKKEPNCARAWALLGLSQARLGHFRYAVRAYREALRGDPDNLAYRHNLGHLLDVSLDAPAEALPHLEHAYALAPGNVHVLTSLLHALVNGHRTSDALACVAAARFECGAESKLRAAVQKLDAKLHGQGAALRGGGRRPRARAVPSPLERALHEGLQRLPLRDDEVRAARWLAAALPPAAIAHDDAALRASAAAVVWAVVQRAHLSLTLGDVAATFRVRRHALRRQYQRMSDELQAERE